MTAIRFSLNMLTEDQLQFFYMANEVKRAIMALWEFISVSLQSVYTHVYQIKYIGHWVRGNMEWMMETASWISTERVSCLNNASMTFIILAKGPESCHLLITTPFLPITLFIKWAANNILQMNLNLLWIWCIWNGAMHGNSNLHDFINFWNIMGHT